MSTRIWLVARRELGAAFDTAIAPVALLVSVLFVGAAFMNSFFLDGRVEMTRFFLGMPLFFAVFVPALTMRLFAEEKKSRTIELLFALPISMAEAVLGKFMASLALLLIFLLGTTPIPLLLAWLGNPDAGAIVAGYLGLFFLGAELCALGLFFSSVTRDQIVAFIAAATSGAALVLLGDARVKSVLDGLTDNPALAPGTTLSEWLSPLPRFEEMSRGVIGLPALVFFLVFTAFFLFATGYTLNRERA